MAVLLSKGAEVLHEIQDLGTGPGHIPGAVYRLAVPDRLMALEYQRDLRDSCDRLAARLGMALLPHHGPVELDALLDEALAALAAGDDLAEIEARVGAYREARDALAPGGRIDPEIAVAYDRIVRQVLQIETAYSEALRDNETRNEIAAECLIRRFVLAIEDAAPFERRRGRLTEADCERIPEAHRVLLAGRISQLFAPSEDEEKKSA